ncbi:cyclin-dependent kinase 11B isoform X1 [Stomoxys calcitrans]|uniref:cyclin-dependent kinase 11B isoform X1 n=1 Tax=Stomoxys calcitrans TaxID=35570 RepID=UPI0027E341A5|nr:cyclin-dependent kinase 11B isoform X1 [Stomoxys calcitrans]XP_059226035.1 cyclin-dependent kinase 11B isoform X1 [Stomoxys calcitrans]
MRGNSMILFILWMASTSSGWAQRSPFSLQAAVDELHRQEYPLNAPPGQQPRYMAGAFGSAADQDYWDEDAAYTFNTKKQRNRINKQLAKYLERENYEADHGGLSLGPFGGYEFDADSNRLSLPPYSEERKRSSVFRERSNVYDDGPASIFRERDVPETLDRSELTDQFLREIERSQEHGHQDRYKEALRSLWEKYQQQENEIDGDVYEEQKKRMRMPPYYMLMQKKRSYPVLPWLPVERKKRFPVSKRSTNHLANEGPISSLGKTDENVERELSELFGSGSDEKKKRSIDDKHEQGVATPVPEATATSLTDMRLESNKNATHAEEKKSPSSSSMIGTDHHQHAGHTMAEHKHGKRSNHQGSHESHEEDAAEEEEEDSEEEHESEEEDEHEHEEEDEEAKRKKKRDATSTKRKRDAVPLRRTMEDLTMRSKKSIDWSNYFGLDRKKKAMSIGDSSKTTDMKKRDAEEGVPPSVAEDSDKKKRNIDPTKLENMNKKLQAIEDFIINETIKYTGAHEGIGDPEEIQRLKDRVLSRLATAYSLEKMRRALEKLRQSVENENHIMHNVIEPDTSDSSENTSLEAAAKRSKNNQLMKSQQQTMGEDKPNEDMRRKMKKSNGFMRYPEVPNEFGDFEETLQNPNRYETLNDAYLGNKNYILGTNQCPILESMAQRCRGVDLLSGDINQELLPLCGVHQLCYLCGTSQIACDYQYLAEADAVCGTSNNNDCQATARSVLMILRGTPGPQLGPRECVKNSCLFSAMREIGL